MSVILVIKYIFDEFFLSIQSSFDWNRLIGIDQSRERKSERIVR